MKFLGVVALALVVCNVLVHQVCAEVPAEASSAPSRQSPTYGNTTATPIALEDPFEGMWGQGALELIQLKAHPAPYPDAHAAVNIRLRDGFMLPIGRPKSGPIAVAGYVEACHFESEWEEESGQRFSGFQVYGGDSFLIADIWVEHPPDAEYLLVALRLESFYSAQYKLAVADCGHCSHMLLEPSPPFSCARYNSPDAAGILS